MTDRDHDHFLLSLLCQHASREMAIALEDAMTRAKVPIYNSGGGSINTLGRMETWLGWRAAYEGPKPLGEKDDGQHEGLPRRGEWGCR